MSLWEIDNVTCGEEPPPRQHADRHRLRPSPCRRCGVYDARSTGPSIGQVASDRYRAGHGHPFGWGIAFEGSPIPLRCQSTFSGTPDEAASRFPENANAALTTALAGTGPQTTRVTLIADPNAKVNRHEIRAEGRFGELSVVLRNKPLEENPKSSALTALNLARCIENRLNPLVI
ncbi:MAG: DUF108 domain-containing protein [Acidimicrobiia bacterium]|nr:DUF108 domain-containing protein [Acidimicrobiia bacterium]